MSIRSAAPPPASATPEPAPTSVPDRADSVPFPVPIPVPRKPDPDVPDGPDVAGAGSDREQASTPTTTTTQPTRRRPTLTPTRPAPDWPAADRAPPPPIPKSRRRPRHRRRLKPASQRRAPPSRRMASNSAAPRVPQQEAQRVRHPSRRTRPRRAPLPESAARSAPHVGHDGAVQRLPQGRRRQSRELRTRSGAPAPLVGWGSGATQDVAQSLAQRSTRPLSSFLRSSRLPAALEPLRLARRRRRAPAGEKPSCPGEPPCRRPRAPHRAQATRPRLRRTGTAGSGPPPSLVETPHPASSSSAQSVSHRSRSTACTERCCLPPGLTFSDLSTARNAVKRDSTEKRIDSSTMRRASPLASASPMA